MVQTSLAKIRKTHRSAIQPGWTSRKLYSPRKVQGAWLPIVDISPIFLRQAIRTSGSCKEGGVREGSHIHGIDLAEAFDQPIRGSCAGILAQPRLAPRYKEEHGEAGDEGQV